MMKVFLEALAISLVIDVVKHRFRYHAERIEAKTEKILQAKLQSKQYKVNENI